MVCIWQDVLTTHIQPVISGEYTITLLTYTETDDMYVIFNAAGRVQATSVNEMSGADEVANFDEIGPYLIKLDDGTIRAQTDDEIAADRNAFHLDAQAGEAREQRRKLLEQSDWVVTKAAESSSAVSSEWITYRQALRDIPSQSEFPASIDWPTKP